METGQAIGVMSNSILSMMRPSTVRQVAVVLSVSWGVNQPRRCPVFKK